MVGKVIQEMIRFFGKDTRRIAHALKVYAYTQAIAELENMDGKTRDITLVAAILHDVGIKIAEDKYGSCTARQQEELGPDAAAAILAPLNFAAADLERIRFLIAHHHSPEASEDMDFRILLEADFLVNFEEENLPRSSVEITAKTHFRTKAGLEFLRSMFG
jgi:HD superfamily phosphodiesterase